jgi:hypothetical protein
VAVARPEKSTEFLEPHAGKCIAPAGGPSTLYFYVGGDRASHL